MWRRVPKLLVPWLDVAWSFIYPEVCQLCRVRPADRRAGYVCAGCRELVRVIQPPFCDRCGLPFAGEITASFQCANCRELELHFAAARSAVAARGPVLESIHRYKYQGEMWFEDFLSEYFIAAARAWVQCEPCDGLVPVPLFPVKERERGFNQAQRLAARLGSALGVPVESRLLQRVVPTPSQTHLSRSQRADNMRRAFALRGSSSLAGKRLVLIDDVFTTGATTSACAKLLLQAGAARVVVWTVARAEFHGG